MKGLDLAELFFNRFGLPAIKEHFPEVVVRISAGLVGRGSEVLGANDEFSRDHGWGPVFELFLPENDFQEIGKEIEAKLNELKPSVFQGIELSQHHTDSITVSTIDGFFRDLTGAPWPPKRLRE